MRTLKQRLRRPRGYIVYSNRSSFTSTTLSPRRYQSDPRPFTACNNLFMLLTCHLTPLPNPRYWSLLVSSSAAKGNSLTWFQNPGVKSVTASDSRRCTKKKLKFVSLKQYSEFHNKILSNTCRGMMLAVQEKTVKMVPLKLYEILQKKTHLRVSSSESKDMIGGMVAPLKVSASTMNAALCGDSGLRPINIHIDTGCSSPYITALCGQMTPITGDYRCRAALQ
ncbi:hypothetical protein J6590_052305 [Homalodisca vitripennis]|nr:hypothetical protein J6590_052305 [Homalodisca vitripennis]